VCELPLPPGSDDGATPRCLQEIGVSGRIAAGDLLPGFGSDNPIDLYAVSGFAGAPAEGLTFGINSGLMPGGGPSLDCAPAAPVPELPAGGVPVSPTLEGNVRPLGAGAMGEYDVGVAIHKSFLDRAGWAMHQTGLLCTTIDGSQVESLNADALSLVFPSIIDLVDGADTRVSIRLRPQRPPTFGLAEGKTPVIARFEDMDVDFFLTVRDRMVRLFSARSDVAVPVGLDVDADGALMPIVGDLSGAFDNVRISDPGLLAEKGDELAAKFKTMGQLSLSLLIQSLGPIDLPATTFARPVFTREGLQAIDGEQYLGIFGTIAIGAAPMAMAPLRARVETTASVIAIEVPGAAAYRALDPARRPAVLIGVSGQTPLSAPLEFQHRIDGGAWSPFAAGPTLRISGDELWLAGRHVIEVRGRHAGQPRTADRTPTMLVVDLHPNGRSPARQVSGAQPPQSERVSGGCASAPPGTCGLWLVLIALFSIRESRRRLVALALAAVLGSGCLIGDDGEKGPAYGRWSDVAADGTRALVSTYESGDGVLAVSNATGVKRYEIVDDAGDVGAWSSIELSGQIARIAYQNRGAGDLKVAIEEPGLPWKIHTVDDGGDLDVGLYADLVMRPGGGMGLAYAGAAEIAGPEDTEGLRAAIRRDRRRPPGRPRRLVGGDPREGRGPRAAAGRLGPARHRPVPVAGLHRGRRAGGDLLRHRRRGAGDRPAQRRRVGDRGAGQRSRDRAVRVRLGGDRRGANDPRRVPDHRGPRPALPDDPRRRRRPSGDRRRRRPRHGQAPGRRQRQADHRPRRRAAGLLPGRLHPAADDGAPGGVRLGDRRGRRRGRRLWLFDRRRVQRRQPDRLERRHQPRGQAAARLANLGCGRLTGA
jgi:hypothetical protein